MVKIRKFFSACQSLWSATGLGGYNSPDVLNIIVVSLIVLLGVIGYCGDDKVRMAVM